jgi:hypothetical protein
MATFIEDVANKNKATAEREASAAEQKAKRPTLEEIRNNPDQKQWESMEVYLQSKGEQEILDRLNEGSSTNEDLETLEKRRDSFLDLEEDLQRTKDQLTPENVERIANLSPELRNLSKFMSPEKIRTAILDNLTDTAMRGGTSYKEMSEMLAMAYQGKVEMNRRMVAFGKEHGFSAEEYKAALMRMDENPKALEHAVARNIGGLRSLFTSAETIKQKALMLDKRSEIAENKARLEGFDKQLGTVMRSFVLENETVRKSFFSRLTRSKKEVAPAAVALPDPTPAAEAAPAAPAPKPVAEVTPNQPAAERAPENKQDKKKVESEADWKKLKVGDRVFWAPKGVEQWTEPKEILEIGENGMTEEKFARFAGSQNYAPLSEMRLAPKGEKAAGANPGAVSEQLTDRKENRNEDRELTPKEIEKIEKDFREAQKTSKEQLSEDEKRDARQKWQKYQIAHKGDEGFNLDDARESFSRGYAKEKYAKEKMSFFSIISRLFFQDKIKEVIKHS